MSVSLTYRYFGNALYKIVQCESNVMYEPILTEAQRCAAKEWAVSRIQKQQQQKEQQQRPQEQQQKWVGTVNDTLANCKRWTERAIFAFVRQMESRLCKRVSTIPNAGYGLFTTVLIPNDFLFAEYRGSIVRDSVLQKQYGTYTASYAIAVRETEEKGHKILHHIDACDPSCSSMARYANDARDVHKNNAEFEQHNSRIFLKATRTIHPGEEIFVSYGWYWGDEVAEAEQAMVCRMIASIQKEWWIAEELGATDEVLHNAIHHHSVRRLSKEGKTMYCLNPSSIPVKTLRSVFQLNTLKLTNQ